MQKYLMIDDNKIGIWVSEHVEPPVLAVNMTAAITLLEGYGLTDEEKENVSDLMAGYCRLVDEARLTGYGDTEFEAIADLFSKAKRV